MLATDFIRQHPERVREACRLKGAPDIVQDLLSLDEKRRSLIRQVEELRSERNRGSKEVGELKRRGSDAGALQARLKVLSEQIGRLEADLSAVEKELDRLLLQIPNVPHPSAPQGASAADNQVTREWGEKPTFSYQPLPHYELCARNGMLALERGAKVAGSFWPCYIGWGARLEMALIQYMLNLHVSRHGYQPVFPPFLVNRAAMTGTGQLPKLEPDLYRLEGDDLFLIPTAEVPVTNLHRDEILPAGALPIKYVAYSACFRREAGAYGKDTRGLARVHQFNKVELVKFVHPEASYDELEKLVVDAEEVLQSLGLHYRVVLLAAGDTSFSAAKCYDLEVWAPGLARYLEVSSCSNFEDFQARRMNCRFRDAEGKAAHVHTLNGSGVATPRLFAAIVETFQNQDGSISVPIPLRQHLGGADLIPAAEPAG